MEIKGSVALVTGANRGLGRAFALALLDAGATKVYAGARDISTVKDQGLTPIQIDVTDPESVAAAAKIATDVNIIVNNAGISAGGSFIGAANLDGARAELETNYFGPIIVARAFAPILKANGGGALVNMLSALSFFTMPDIASYSATKSAAWSATNALRLELNGQGTLVVGVHAGAIDTDMTKGWEIDKISVKQVADATIEGILKGSEEVLADDTSRHVKAGLTADVRVQYPSLV